MKSMKKGKIRWGWIILYPIALRLLMIILTFPYMIVYSFAVNPGMSEEFYKNYVFDNRAWISTGIGLPVFYLACYIMARRIKVEVVRNCLFMVGVYIIMDVPLEIVVGDPTEWTLLIAHSSKLIVGYWAAVNVKNQLE